MFVIFVWLQLWMQLFATFLCLKNKQVNFKCELGYVKINEGGLLPNSLNSHQIIRSSPGRLKLGDSWVFQQKNDPKHTSEMVLDWIMKVKIKLLECRHKLPWHSYEWWLNVNVWLQLLVDTNPHSIILCFSPKKNGFNACLCNDTISGSGPPLETLLHTYIILLSLYFLQKCYQ